MLTFAVIVSYAAAAAFVAALGFGAVRRWRVAGMLASSATLASVGVLILLFGRFVVSSRSIDPASKAEALASSLSEMMNCGLIPLLVAVAGSLIWSTARKRLGSAH